MLSRRTLLKLISASTFFSSGALAQKKGSYNPLAFTFYQPDAIIRSRLVSEDAFLAYAGAVSDEQRDVLASFNDLNANAVVVFALKPPARSRVWIMSGDAAAEARLTRILKSRLEKIRPPAVTSYVAFSTAFELGAGGRPPELFQDTYALPPEWIKAFPTTRRALIPDDALKVIWPD